MCILRRYVHMMMMARMAFISFSLNPPHSSAAAPCFSRFPFFSTKCCVVSIRMRPREHSASINFRTSHGSSSKCASYMRQLFARRDVGQLGQLASGHRVGARGRQRHCT